MLFRYKRHLIPIINLLAPEKHIPVIELPGSKSISNRLLMIKAIGNLNFEIENVSDSDDTKNLASALREIKFGKKEIDVGHAGTNMRFLCSYLASLNGKISIITGSDRMKQRPIKELVESLINIGAEISYAEKEGFPPLIIKGKQLTVNEIEIMANVSSQYVSSLLLVSPLLKNGCSIKLKGNIVSLPYIKMTADLMHNFGIELSWIENVIKIKPGSYKEPIHSFYNESDWSAASYFYCALRFSEFNKIELIGLIRESVQPDSKLIHLFEPFGIQTEITLNKTILTKTERKPSHFSFNFSDCPDIAQTFAALCTGLKITADLTGLSTLKIKETDRIVALKNELQKFGALVETTNDSLHIKGYQEVNYHMDILVNTYNDHRMAMSLSPLKFLYPNMVIENKEVVSKSFPKYWDQFSKLC